MTTIIAKYVNPPKPDKKYGSIKTPEGVSYMLPAGMVDAFVQGATYDVPVKQETWGKGDDAKVVNIIAGRPGSAGSGVVNQQPAPQAAASAAPPPMRSARMGDTNDMSIFVTGIVGRAMGSGKFGATDIDALTKCAIAAYKANLA